VLRGNSQEFLRLARMEFERARIQARVDLEQKEMAIGSLVGPIGDALAIYNEKLDAIERARLSIFNQLAERLDVSLATSEQLRNEAAALARR
jgi:DNA recombination protein RmuC